LVWSSKSQARRFKKIHSFKAQGKSWNSNELEGYRSLPQNIRHYEPQKKALALLA
jgi:hypothetical protein